MHVRNCFDLVTEQPLPLPPPPPPQQPQLQPLLWLWIATTMASLLQFSCSLLVMRARCLAVCLSLWLTQPLPHALSPPVGSARRCILLLSFALIVNLLVAVPSCGRRRPWQVEDRIMEHISNGGPPIAF